MSQPILKVAVPSPVHRLFDYRSPAGCTAAIVPGVRVRVPFGRTTTVGVVMGQVARSELAPQRLKSAETILDSTPLLPPDILALATWAAEYYHHPVGEVLATLLPTPLRRGQTAAVRTSQVYIRSVQAPQDDDPLLHRAPQQARVLALLAEHPGGLSRQELTAAGIGAQVIRALLARAWIETREPDPLSPRRDGNAGPPLNADQAAAVERIRAATGRYQGFLLEGVTGSGKTEVYLDAIRSMLDAGRQTLVVVPEIGLTPQLVARFRERLGVQPALLHSGLSDGERLNAWLAARAGSAGVIIGTRSAAWVPLARPGLFIVDEEHDGSLKQQEGLRYSARDLLVWRAHHNRLPIVLGSATPALESLHNVSQGRYTDLPLPQRAGNARAPHLQLVDVRNQPLDEGLSAALIRNMQRHLQQDNQVLLFLNRRGYAPTLLCHACGWVAECRRCDAHLTLHQRHALLRCHHCAGQQGIPAQCPACGCADLRAVGTGTERVERALKQHFAGVPHIRIDRDNTRRKGALEDLLNQASDGSARILLGTQMLSKGHHFPGVTLVGILDADAGLFSADFRAGERLAQQIIQVAGRAGRADRPGEVLIQTHHPDHPLLNQLVQAGYPAFARACLAERRAAALPPYSNLAMLRAEAVDGRAPMQFLEAAAAAITPAALTDVERWGPLPAPMERRAGRFRAQLLLVARERKRLHRLLDAWVPRLGELKSARKVRWSLDVDPIDLY